MNVSVSNNKLRLWLSKQILFNSSTKNISHVDHRVKLQSILFFQSIQDADISRIIIIVCLFIDLFLRLLLSISSE